jgi:hypothetical protein
MIGPELPPERVITYLESGKGADWSRGRHGRLRHSVFAMIKPQGLCVPFTRRFGLGDIPWADISGCTEDVFTEDVWLPETTIPPERV